MADLGEPAPVPGVWVRAGTHLLQQAGGWEGTDNCVSHGRADAVELPDLPPPGPPQACAVSGHSLACCPAPRSAEGEGPRLPGLPGGGACREVLEAPHLCRAPHPLLSRAWDPSDTPPPPTHSSQKGEGHALEGALGEGLGEGTHVLAQLLPGGHQQHVHVHPELQVHQGLGGSDRGVEHGVPQQHMPPWATPAPNVPWTAAKDQVPGPPHRLTSSTSGQPTAPLVRVTAGRPGCRVSWALGC